MELQKDNQKDKTVSVIPYSPDLFHNDRDFYLAYRKIEHIVAAVFLVSGLIEQDSLTKNSIREHSLECLSRIVALVGKPSVAVTDLQIVAAQVLHLSSLLDIGFWSGQISQMNLSILQKEISFTYQTLNDLSSKYKNTFYIGASFFKTDTEILNATEVNVSKTKEIKSIIQDQSHQRQVGVNNIDIRQTGKEDYKRQNIRAESDKGQRRESILALLGQKPNLSVKDFVAVVPEYSEKTIQRELSALVEEGVIKKEGERRWSTYSLAG